MQWATLAKLNRPWDPAAFEEIHLSAESVQDGHMTIVPRRLVRASRLQSATTRQPRVN
jgi:hypothetical protein